MCLLVSPAGSTAKELTVISFTAEVYNSLVPQNAFEIARPGDEVHGTLIYDPDLTAIPETSTRNRFDLLDGGSGHFEVEVNGHTFFQTPRLDNGTAPEHYSIVRLESTGRKVNGKELYKNSFGVWCLSNGLPTYTQADHINIGLLLSQNEATEPLQIQSLPTHPELTDYSDAYFKLRIEQPGEGDNYIEARVTSLTVERGAYSRVQGSVYIDRNGDCLFNGSDLELARRILRVTPGNRMTATNRNGNYNILLKTGQYAIEAVTDESWHQICPTGSAQFSIQAEAEPVLLDLGLEPYVLRESADVSIVSGGARPGFNIRYVITVSNTGTLPYDGELRFNYDPILTDFNSTPLPDEFIQAEAVWHLNNLPIGGEVTFEITLRVPPDETLLGQQLCAWARIDKDNKGSDDLLGNNVDDICQEIRGSYDPNDMHVFAETANADGPILPEFKELDYIIRFQNEGSVEAVTVRVVDELSEFHNIGKLRIGACSHDFEFNFTENNALEWTFNNINLPPKSEDEEASQGFIKFHIQLNDDLPPGTEIPNQAAIHFDYNKAVLTNTVVSRIAQTTTDVEIDDNAINLRVFPNPAAETLNIDLGDKQEGRQKATFSIRNLLGQVLLQGELNSRQSTINLNALTNGMYFLTVQAQNGVRTSPLNVAR